MDLPSLELIDPSQGGRCEVASVFKGGDGQLGVQGQEMLYNLRACLKDKRIEVLRALGWNVQLGISGMLARMTGLSKGSVEHLGKKVAVIRESQNRWL